MAHLANMGFEMFEETDTGLKAYIPSKDFTEAMESDLVPDYITSGVKFSKQLIKNENWNAVWESNFEPELIAGKVYVRADFHPPQNQYEFQLVIQPKMAFGTGHHPTTALVIELMLQLNFIGKSVLDMGCGTGILAILAEKLGAESVLAIDNDENAVINTKENIFKNACHQISVEQGDAKTPGIKYFNLIIANINRNIILNDLPLYAANLMVGGEIVFSGFYEKDLVMIQETAEELNLEYQKHLIKNEWCCAYFKKME